MGRSRLSDRALNAVASAVSALEALKAARAELAATGEAPEVVELLPVDLLLSRLERPVNDLLRSESGDMHLVYCGDPGTHNSHVHLAMPGALYAVCGRAAGTRLTAERVPLKRFCGTCRSGAGDISDFVAPQPPAPTPQVAPA